MHSANVSGWSKTACVLFVLSAAAAIASPAQTFTTLVNFNGTNGANPYFMSPIQSTDGNLYGTTSAGANYSACQPGCGTVFKVTPTGTLTTLYAFCAQANCTDGTYPFAGLVLGADDNFYGTTRDGGANGDYGTIFKITAGGAPDDAAQLRRH